MCATHKAPSFLIEDILSFKPKTSKELPIDSNDSDERISDTKKSLDPTCDTRKTILKNSTESNPPKRKTEISNRCASPENLQTYSLQSKRRRLHSHSIQGSTNNIDPPNSVNVIKTVSNHAESRKSVDLSKFNDQSQHRNYNSISCSLSTRNVIPALSERLFNNAFSSSSEPDYKTISRGSSENYSHAFPYGIHSNLLSFAPRESAAFKYTNPYYDKSVVSSLNLRNGFNYFSECSPTSEQASMLRQGFSGRYFHHPISYYPYGLDRGQGACGFWPLSLGKRKGGQVRFSAHQTAALEKRFVGNKYLSPEDRRALATSLKLTDRQVKTWFQNRRAKWRRANNLSPEDKSEGNSNDESVSDCATPHDADT